MDYLGVPVLTTNPNRVPSIRENQRLEKEVLDAKTTPATVRPPTRVPSRARTYELLSLNDAARAHEFRQFLMARQGRLKPFWAPSWQRDLVLAQASGSGVGTIVIRECGYATRIWPTGAARRHLVLRSPSGTLVMRRVASAVSNGNATETLTLIGPAGETTLGIAVGVDWLVMFARYVRLDADEIQFRWRGKVAQLELPVIDLSAETPA
jgi:hypothetical protein